MGAPTTTPHLVPVCTTCGQTPANPFRDRVNGEVRYGCVDRAHDDHADAWHLRPAAAAIRATKPADFADPHLAVPVDRNRDWIA